MKSSKFSNRIKYSELILITTILLFFLQLFSDFVETVYIFALMTLSLNINVLSVLFFLSSLALLIFRKKVPRKVVIFIGEMLVLARILEPLFDTKLRMIVSGLGVGCFMVFFPAYLHLKRREDEESSGITIGLGFVIALSTSVLFRILNSSVDLSTYGWFQSIGWVLGLVVSFMLISLVNKYPTQDEQLEESSVPQLGEVDTDRRFKGRGRVLGLAFGIFSIILLINFVFNGTTVLARWTEVNYIFITVFISVQLFLIVIVIVLKPELINAINSRILWLLNGIFVVSLVLTIFGNQVIFPSNPDMFPIIVGSPTVFLIFLLIMTLITFPIIFIDFILIIRQLIKIQPSIPKLAGSFTLGGGLYMLLMVFSIVFTSTWGFVPPVSYYFRDMLWAIILAIGLIAIIPLLIVDRQTRSFKRSMIKIRTKIIALSVGFVICTGSITSVSLIRAIPLEQSPGKTSLKVITYNLQQGVDDYASKNYDGQLNLIREMNADIIGLQETSKIAGNSDVIRYFADKLNMYSYFGPRGVTGTTGVALLSKYPIENAITFYHYSRNSDQKQTATIEAEISINSETFTIYVTHTYGSITAKSILINDTLARADGKENVIIMGDFNFRQYSESYNLTTNVLIDTWLDIWPTGIDDEGLNASRRIDHIFVSSNLNITDCRYIDWYDYCDLESYGPCQSDHPLYWVEFQL